MDQTHSNPRIITTPKSSSPPRDIELSMLGQPPSAATGPGNEDEVEDQDQELCSDPVLARVWENVGNEDFGDIILQDGLDTKDGLLMKGERHISRFNQVFTNFPSVPELPPPTCRPSKMLIPGTLASLVSNGNEIDHIPLKEVKGIKPLNLELSWMCVINIFTDLGVDRGL